MKLKLGVDKLAVVLFSTVEATQAKEQQQVRRIKNYIYSNTQVYIYIYICLVRTFNVFYFTCSHLIFMVEIILQPPTLGT